MISTEYSINLGLNAGTYRVFSDGSLLTEFNLIGATVNLTGRDKITVTIEDFSQSIKNLIAWNNLINAQLAPVCYKIPEFVEEYKKTPNKLEVSLKFGSRKVLGAVYTKSEGSIEFAKRDALDMTWSEFLMWTGALSTLRSLIIHF